MAWPGIQSSIGGVAVLHPHVDGRRGGHNDQPLLGRDQTRAEIPISLRRNPGFLPDFAVEFWGNSLAMQLCSNYQPPLCASGRNMEFLDWLSAS